MRSALHRLELLCSLIVLIGLAACAPLGNEPAEVVVGPPPETRVDLVVDDYHGVQVADPYRWLEDTDSPETRAWIEAQNEVTFDFLGRIPEREGLRQRLTAATGLKLQHSREQLAHLAQLLDSLSPLGTLQRGYAIITDADGKVVTDASTVAVGDELEGRLAKGRLGLTVNKVD